MFAQRIKITMYYRSKISILSSFIFFSSYCGSAQNTSWTIKQCIDTAIINNLNIQQSANTIELNRIALKQSKNNLLPTVNGNAGETLGIGRNVNPVTDLYQAGTVWSTNVALNFSQSIFNGLQFLN